MRLSTPPPTCSAGHGLRGARSRAFYHRGPSFGVRAQEGLRRSRGLNLEEGALLFADARFGRSDFDAPSSQPSRRSIGTAPELATRRRLAAPWMRTPRAWSSVATAGGAFTEIVPSSDVLLSPSGTTASVPSRPVATAPQAFFSMQSRIHPRSQDRPTVLPRGE